jgi:predicted MPP superfamily phosphohydrolase
LHVENRYVIISSAFRISAAKLVGFHTRMKPIRLLHISDIHFEPPTDRGERTGIQNSLVDKVSELEFDVVILSGDVADTGKDAEYKEATKFLNELAHNRTVLVIPGNHDVDRTRATNRDLFNARASEEHFETNRDHVLAPERFESFREFAAPFSFAWDPARMTLVCTSILGVTFVGINTALLSYEKEETGKLAVDLKDLEARFGELGKGVPVVTIGHHPFDELSPWNRDRVKTVLGRHLRGAHLYLCGHRHLPKGESSYSSSGSGLALYQAGAAYQTSQWENSFSLLTIDPCQSQQLRPRLFVFNDNSGTFDEDPSRSHPLPIVWPSKQTEQQVPAGSAIAQAQTVVQSLPPDRPEELLKTFEDVFGLVWEPGSGNQQIGRIFWPVRLRRPTLIHAAQAFIAAAFQKRGISVVLCLDDLGNTGSQPELFLERMRKHFSYVSADWSQVEVICARQVVSAERLQSTWELLAKWLTDTADLRHVLNICKLLVQEASAEQLEEMLGKKPRKLMTPAVVWSCLEHVLTRPDSGSASGTSLSTLGGHDERGSWQAWQNVFSARYNKRVGHLYGPALQKISATRQEPAGGDVLAMAEHDSDRDLDWRSKEEIQTTLRKDAGRVTDRHRILGWLVSQCLVLPTWLAGRELKICGQQLREPRDVASLSKLPREDVVREVAARAREVLLE